MVCHCASGNRAGHGFTVIELLMVLAAIGLLLSIAAPRYVAHVERAREVALKHDLKAMRDAIDKFRTDQAHYPDSLDDLVSRRYLRGVPQDPFTERSDTWLLVPALESGQGVFDVRSGARGLATDGSAYASW